MSKKLDKKAATISDLDRKLLKILLSPNGDLKSTKGLSAKLSIPVTTVRRRRKRLESKFLKMNAVANKMLDFDEVTYIGKSIGEHTIDLRVETILKDNASILDFLEKIKAMDGVKDVVWSEIVSVVGRKISIPSSIIDRI